MIAVLLRWRRWITLVILAHAPWHDAYTLGQRGKIAIGPFSWPAQSWAGLINAGVAAFIILFFGVPLIQKVFQNKIKPRADSILYGLLFVLMLSHLTSIVGSTISLLSFLALGSLLFSVDARGNVPGEQDFLNRWGYSVLLISYVLALFLPMLIPISNYKIMQLFVSTYRYRGWVGEGQPIGFVGAILSIWGFYFGLTNPQKWRWAVLGVVFGILGVYLNVLRIALLGLLGYYSSMAAWMIFKRQNWKITTLVFLALSLSAGLLATESFRKKNTQQYHLGRGQWYEASPSNLKYIDPTSPVDIDRVIVTTGRVFIWKKLLDELSAQNKWFFGFGTGGSRPILEKHENGPEPGGDYMRIFAEQGVIGLLLFLGFLGCFLWRWRRSLLFPLLVAYAALLTTDAFFIMPSFGFVPLLLVGFIIPTDA